MPKLRLLLGPPGSGKTERVIREIVDVVAEDRVDADPRKILQHSPLLLIVPEQQAISMEHQVFTRLAAATPTPHSRISAGRIRVLSLSRLGRLFESLAGVSRQRVSEIGRRMLAWRLCEPSSGRDARAEALASLLAELELYGAKASLDHESAADAVSLKQRAEAIANLAQSAPIVKYRARYQRLSEKLQWLAQMLEEYRTACELRGLAFGPPYLAIRPEAWPAASRVWQEPWEQAQVWVDGFAGFTPSEEQAMHTLLKCCTEVTATVLIDRARLEQPAPTDQEDWYQAPRQLYQFWLRAASSLGIVVNLEADLIWLPLEQSTSSSINPGAETRLPRWEINHPIAHLAQNGFSSWRAQTTGIDAPRNLVSAASCGNEREEVEVCCRQIMDWVQLNSIRFGDISIITRDLEPYADLLKCRLKDYEIPHFIDRREDLSHHPLVEYLRCTIRIALGLGQKQDVYTLLKTDLLFSSTQQLSLADRRGISDELERFGRCFDLDPCDWISQNSWVERYAQVQEILQRNDFNIIELDLRRKQAFRVPFQLCLLFINSIKISNLTIQSLLSMVAEHVLSVEILQELDTWDREGAANASGIIISTPPNYHRRVADAVLETIENFVILAGDLHLDASSVVSSNTTGITKTCLVQWFDFGLKHLTLGIPPHAQDSVLVTDIVRGRHLPVRAAVVLGLADDTWPAAARQTPLLSDWERSVINDHLGHGKDLLNPHKLAQKPTCSAGKRIVAPGSAAEATRESLYALLALTRSSERLLCLYPRADHNGRERFPSRNIKDLLDIGCKQESFVPITEGLKNCQTDCNVYCIQDLALLVSLNANSDAMALLLEEFTDQNDLRIASLNWAQRYANAPCTRPMPGNLLSKMLAPDEWTSRLRLQHTDNDRLDKVVLSPSQLEMFGMCPFKYFASYWLRLLYRNNERISFQRIGTLIHNVLCKTVQNVITQHIALGSNEDWVHHSLDWHNFYSEASAILDSELLDNGELWRRQRVEQIRTRCKILLGYWARQLAQQLQTEPGRWPAFAELELGRLSSHGGNLQMKIGEFQFELNGIIDRLDVDQQGRAVVVDYKLGGGQFELWRMLAGVDLQLCLYLMALRGRKVNVAGREIPLNPIRAELQRIEPRIERGELSFKETQVPKISSLNKERQAILAEGDLLLSALLTECEDVLEIQLQRLADLEISPAPLRSPTQNWTACSGCDFRPLCRFDPAAGDPYREARSINMREWQLSLLAPDHGGRE